MDEGAGAATRRQTSHQVTLTTHAIYKGTNSSDMSRCRIHTELEGVRTEKGDGRIAEAVPSGTAVQAWGARVLIRAVGQRPATNG